jgi:hypothetical protein
VSEPQQPQFPQIDELPSIELPNLLYCNNNPRPWTICELCLPLIGEVFVPGTEPPLPAHPHCYCYYQNTNLEPTNWTAKELLPDDFDPDDPDPDHYDMRPGCMGWIRNVIRRIRDGLAIPWSLLPLLPIALFLIARQDEEQQPDEGPNDPDEPPRNRPQEYTPMQTKSTALTQSLHLQLIDSGTDLGHRAYQCLLIGAGRVRTTDGSDSRWLIPPEALQPAAHLFDGVPSYIDHPSMFGFGWHQEPSLRDLAGVCLNATWSEEEQGIAGIIRLYDDDPQGAGAMIGALYDQILADRAAGIATPQIGLSAVLWHSSHMSDQEDLEITDHIAQVDSVDHVYSAGARGYVREALARVGWDDGPWSATASHISIPSHLGAPLSAAPAPTPQGGTMPPVADPRQGEERTDPGQPETPQASPPVVTEPAGSNADPVTVAHLLSIQEMLAGLTDRMHRLEQAQSQISLAMAQAEEQQTIQDMGIPPRAVAYGMRTGYEELEQAAEALLSGVRPPSGVRPLSGIRELYTLLSGDYELTGIYQADRVYLANVTSSTMAQLVANVLNKRVMIAFQEYPQWWRPIVTIENFTSLQQIRWITLGGVGELPTVNEGAAYTELTWDDLAQRDSFVKKGGYLGLTIEAIDKDDTRRVQSAPRALAQAAWLTLSKSISDIFTSNSGVGPNIYYDDSNTRALFHASNSNLGTTALSAAAWESTRQKMRDQAEHNSSEPLGALTAPRYLLVPNELEFTALQILATENIPGSANYNINPEAQGDAREARLRSARERVIVMDLWTDANDWAAVADPQLYPSIGLGFRFGETPEIFSVADPRAGLMFSNDVMPVKVRYSYATGPVDWRGMYKHNVT